MNLYSGIKPSPKVLTQNDEWSSSTTKFAVSQKLPRGEKSKGIFQKNMVDIFIYYFYNLVKPQQPVSLKRKLSGKIDATPKSSEKPKQSFICHQISVPSIIYRSCNRWILDFPESRSFDGKEEIWVNYL